MPGPGPANAVSWLPRGAPADDVVFNAGLTAFANQLGVKRRDVEGTVLCARNDSVGNREVFGQAWFGGEPAHTFGYRVSSSGSTLAFVGPTTAKDPSVLAFVLGRTLTLLPLPGVGDVSYAASVTAPYRVVANGRSDLDGVGVVERDPASATDAVEVRFADGSVAFRSDVLPLVCGGTLACF